MTKKTVHLSPLQEGSNGCSLLNLFKNKSKYQSNSTGKSHVKQCQKETLNQT